MLITSLLLFLLGSTQLNAQAKQDSLKRVVLSSSSTDSAVLDALFHLSWDIFLFNNLDSSFYYAKNEFQKAVEADNKHSQARALNTLGVVMYFRGLGTKAIDYYSQSLKIREQINDSVGISATLGNIGMIHRLHGRYEAAVEYHEKALKIETSMNNLEGVAKSNNSLGNVFFEKQDYSRALTSYAKALKLAEELGDSSNISTFMNNVGLVMLKQQKLDSATHYFNTTIQIQSDKGDIRGKTNSLNNLGVTLMELGLLDSAESVIRQSYELAKANQFAIELRESSNSLYSVLRKQSNYEGALRAHEEYLEVRDSLVNEENQRNLIQNQFQYEYDKKALADSLDYVKKQAVIAEVSKRQQISLGAAMVGLALLLALVFAIYRGKQRSDNLLLNILPEETANELKQSGKVKARRIEGVSVMFTDFVGFTKAANEMKPELLVSELDRAFSVFDDIVLKYGLEKIKTIGDAYMATSNLSESEESQCRDLVQAALDIIDWMKQSNLPFEIRIGIHTGPVVAGVVGKNKFQYDLWGDTVNTASRMETNGEPGKVNISLATYQLISNEFRFVEREEHSVKGKGNMKMYFVEPQSK